MPSSGPGYLVCFRQWLRFSDVTGGTSKTGWVPECYGNSVWSGNNASLPANASPVQVSKRHETQHINATVRPGGAISGQIAKRNGKRGIRGDVYVRSVGAPHYRHGFGTDGFGRYRVNDLPPAPGGYQVCFNPTPDEFTPTPGYVPRCHGTRHWFGFPTQAADSSDMFTQPQWPSAATHIPVHPGTAATRINARVRPAGAVSGRIVNRATGKRVGDPGVRVYDRRGRLVGSTFAFEGRFKVTGLPPAATDYVCVFPLRYFGTRQDSYQRGCYRNTAWTGPSSRTSGASVHVDRGRTAKGVVVELRRASTIEGALTAARSGQPVTGRVYLYTSSGKFLASDGTDGRFQFFGLPASRSGYLVCASAIRRKHLERPWLRPRCFGGARWDGASGAPARGAKPIPIGADQHRRGVDIALRRGSAISGRIPDTGFHPFRTRLYVIDDLGHHVVQTEVRSDNTWAVEGLDPARSYRICLANPPRHWESQPTCYPNALWYRPWAV